MNTIANSDSWCLRFKLPPALNFGGFNRVVHHCLKSSWCIGQAKGKNPKLVMTKRGPECSLRFVLIPKQDLLELRCCIKAREVLCTKQFVKQIINPRQRVAILHCNLCQELCSPLPS